MLPSMCTGYILHPSYTCIYTRIVKDGFEASHCAFFGSHGGRCSQVAGKYRTKRRFLAMHNDTNDDTWRHHESYVHIYIYIYTHTYTSMFI